jgi:integrase
VLTREQARSTIEALPERAGRRKSPVRAYYEVLWAAGFRRETMTRLRWEDVDLEHATVGIRAAADKCQYARVLPLTPEAVAALERLGDGVGLLFGPSRYTESLRAAARRAGVPAELADAVTDRVLRHSRLTDLAGEGCDVAALQYIAGHKHLTTTSRYVHGSLERARGLLARRDGTSGALAGAPASEVPRPK